MDGKLNQKVMWLENVALAGHMTIAPTHHLNMQTLLFPPASSLIYNLKIRVHSSFMSTSKSSSTSNLMLTIHSNRIEAIEIVPVSIIDMVISTPIMISTSTSSNWRNEPQYPIACVPFLQLGFRSVRIRWGEMKWIRERGWVTVGDYLAWVLNQLGGWFYYWVG